MKGGGRKSGWIGGVWKEWWRGEGWWRGGGGCVCVGLSVCCCVENIDFFFALKNAANSGDCGDDDGDQGLW